MERKGDSLDLQGQAGSINAVANFITQLKRSGYFTNVEIKDAQETDLVKSAQTFGFSMTAAIANSSVPPGTEQATPKPAAATPPPQPAVKGRS
jgi:Tfp pilus assembly protein PilN